MTGQLRRCALLPVSLTAHAGLRHGIAPKLELSQPLVDPLRRLDTQVHEIGLRERPAFPLRKGCGVGEKGRRA